MKAVVRERGLLTWEGCEWFVRDRGRQQKHEGLCASCVVAPKGVGGAAAPAMVAQGKAGVLSHDKASREDLDAV